jgi:preprotein translocase subunit SecG
MEILGFGDPVLAGVLNDVFVYSFRAIFFLSALLLMVIVLLQEGKGGGLASALGGQGAETFGVSSGGVNKVTLFLAGLFLFSALGHALSTRSLVGTLRNESRSRTPGATTPLDGTGGGGTVEIEKPGAPPEGPPKEPPKDPPKAPPEDAPKDAPKDAPPAPPKEGGN